MDINRFPLKSMDHGYTSKDSIGLPLKSMEVHRYPWTFMDTHVFLWIPCAARVVPMYSSQPLCEARIPPVTPAHPACPLSPSSKWTPNRSSPRGSNFSLRNSFSRFRETQKKLKQNSTNTQSRPWNQTRTKTVEKLKTNSNSSTPLSIFGQISKSRKIAKLEMNSKLC